jgi:protein transport protein SEC23
LDSISIKHDDILLLDTFFHILIFHEEVVAQWRKQRPRNTTISRSCLRLRCRSIGESFRHKVSRFDSVLQGLLVDRFPIPRYIVCEQGSSTFLYRNYAPQ